MAKMPSNEVLKDLHRRMVRIRIFEEEAGKLMENGKIPGALHLNVGQEAVPSGVMVNLNDDDQITSTHRGHGHLVAKGGEFKPMYAELFGRSTGYCKGKGGSMHISNIPIFLLTVVVTAAILRYQLLDAALFVSMSATYLPLIPFALVLILFAHTLGDPAPTVFAGVLVLTTVAFTILYVAFQPRLQSALNQALFPGRYDAYNTLTRFSHAMVMNLDLASLQTEIVHTLQTVMGIEKLSLFLFEKDQGWYGLKASYGVDEERVNAVQLTSHGPFANFLLKQNQPIVKEEFQHGLLGQDETETGTLVEALTKMDAEVCIPLVNKGRLIGFVNLGHKPSQEFYSPVDPRRIACPVLNIYASQDHIVPPSASKPLAGLVGSRDYTPFDFQGGHIGIYVSRSAQELLPHTIARWLGSRT